MNKQVRIGIIVLVIVSVAAVVVVSLMKATGSDSVAELVLGTPTPIDPNDPVAVAQATATAVAKREEQALREVHDVWPDAVLSKDDCSQHWRRENACWVIEAAHLITRPEWEELFPNAEVFASSGTVLMPPGSDHFERPARPLVIIEQDRKRYLIGDFDQLLQANNIIITDDNRELVAKAFALMTIPDFLDRKVIFTISKEVDLRGTYHWNYHVQAWTEIYGFEIDWYYVFSGTILRIVGRDRIQNAGVGDYVEADIYFPELQDYFFQGE